MKPVRSEEHKRFIRLLPCLCCACSGKLNQRHIEAAHTPGARGMGQKRSDLDTVPACRTHHKIQHDKGWPWMIRKYGLDLAEALRMFTDKPVVTRHGELPLRKWGGPWVAYFTTSEPLTLSTSFETSLKILPQRRAEQLIETYFADLIRQARQRVEAMMDEAVEHIVPRFHGDGDRIDPWP